MNKVVNYFLFLVLYLTISCAKDPSEYGKVTSYGAGNDKTFIFSVAESYVQKHKESSPDSDHPKMTKAEAKLLDQLLHRQNICINDYHNAIYEITSKQEKIYDMTFASLIQENYNARPIVPRRYYGKCNNVKSPLEPDVRRW